MTTRKMIALTLLRIFPMLCLDRVVLEDKVNPAIPIATAAKRARRMRVLFAVILEIGFLASCPLRIPLQHKNKK